jgi:hypothetical protein
MICPRATLGGRGSHDSLEAILGGEAVMTRPRPPSGGRHNHDSSEAKPERDRQPRIAWGHSRARQAVTTRPRPTPKGRRSHDSIEAKPWLDS